MSRRDRPVKRRRTSASPPIVDDKHARFTQWAVSQGIQINGVEPASLPGRGMGLLTTRKLKRNERLIMVPEFAMIKPDSRLFRSDCHSPQGQLTATLMHLQRQKDDRLVTCAAVWPPESDFSGTLPWYGRSTSEWSLPAPVRHFPRVIRSTYDRLLEDAKRDHSQVLSNQTEDPAWTAAFWYAWTIANTRSFSWKPKGRKVGSMVICPFLDYMNHCPSGAGCEVSMTNKGYELVANRDYDVGEEILATYGAHSNDKLLSHYGFFLREPFDADDNIALDEIILPHYSDSQKKNLESVGYLGNYRLTPSTGEICFRTQVALRADRLTSNEWEFYMNSGDDIGRGADADVKKALTELIDPWLDERLADRLALSAMMDEEAWRPNRPVLNDAVERWQQIEDALRAYCAS